MAELNVVNLNVVTMENVETLVKTLLEKQQQQQPSPSVEAALIELRHQNDDLVSAMDFDRHFPKAAGDAAMNQRNSDLCVLASALQSAMRILSRGGDALVSAYVKSVLFGLCQQAVGNEQAILHCDPGLRFKFAQAYYTATKGVSPVTNSR